MLSIVDDIKTLFMSIDDEFRSVSVNKQNSMFLSKHSKEKKSEADNDFN